MHWVLAWKFRDPSNASTVRVALQQLHGIPMVLHVCQALALCDNCSTVWYALSQRDCKYLPSVTDEASNLDSKRQAHDD